ncbi:MAG: hypothetical protein WBW73_17325, partial [Rhodoplanes sp.]
MFAVPAGERRSDMRANDGMTRELGGRGGRIGAEQRLAAADIQPGQRADILAVGTGDDGVLEHRRAGANDTDAQQSDMHPDAAQGGQRLLSYFNSDRDIPDSGLRSICYGKLRGADMVLDWLALQLRLSLFSSEPMPVSEVSWTAVTGQAEAENRAAVPGGKQYSGKFSGGILTVIQTSARADVILAPDETSVKLDDQFPAIGKWDESSESFASLVLPFLEGMEASIVRIAFGAVLLSGAQSKEHAYETLDWLLDS